MMTRTLQPLAITFLVFGLATPLRVAAAEAFDYKVTYDGMFTAFQEVGIGDARLDVVQTAALVDGEPVMRARLTASSAAYPVVEGFYPFRYEFTSYHQPEQSRTLAYERRKQTTRLRHDLLLADWSAGKVKRFRIEDANEGQARDATAEEMLTRLSRAGLPDYRDQLAPHPGQLAAPGQALDRLALLQQVRNLPMQEGAVHELTVTDGKEIIRYSARIAARETVSTGAGERPAWKVRIDGFEDAEVSGYDTGRESVTGFEEQGEERLRHPPVYVWIDSGPRRVPLRLVSRHAVGKFTVDLHEERTIQSAALPAYADTRLAR